MNDGATMNDPIRRDPSEQFRADIDAVERRVAGEIDPGMRAVVVAVLVVLLLASFVLPHTGDARGYDVLLGDSVALGESIRLPSRLFLAFAFGFGVCGSMLALLTRRWVLAWIALAGSAVGCVFGMLAVWSRQTLPGQSGPGIGLIMGWLVLIVLTFHWLRVVWSKTALQLAAENERRTATAAQQQDWRGPR
ncbi:hypothetical protein [Skermania piniformis]